MDEERLIDYWFESANTKRLHKENATKGPLRLKAMSTLSTSFMHRVLIVGLSGRELIIFANEIVKDNWKIGRQPIIYPCVSEDRLNFVDQLTEFFTERNVSEDQFVVEIQHFFKTLVAAGWRKPTIPASSSTTDPTSTSGVDRTSITCSNVESKKYSTTRKAWSCSFCPSSSSSCPSPYSIRRCKLCGLLLASKVYQDLLR